MLKDALAVLYVFSAAAALLTEGAPLGILLLLASGISLVSGRRQALPHHVERLYNRLAARILQISLIVLALAILAAALTSYSLQEALRLYTTVIAALLPASLICIRFPAIKSDKRHVRGHSSAVIIRSGLAASMISVSVLAAGTLGAAFGIIPAILPAQLLLLNVLLVPLLLSSLVHDPTLHKSAEHKHALKLSEVLETQRLFRLAGHCLVVAVIVYANYLLFFARRLMSPVRIDPTLPQYHQAATMSVLATLLCLLVFIAFERSDTHPNFFTEHLSSNKNLLKAVGLALAAFAVLTCTPGLRAITGSAPLNIVDWAAAIFAAGIYTLARLLQRHTRKHTRRALIELHRNARETA